MYGYGRILEDVIHRLVEAGADPADSDLAAYRALAEIALGPDEGRPESGAALVRRLP